MAAIIDHVRPGDLISSDLVNRIITLLNEHEALLASGSTNPQTGLLLTGFSPPTEQNLGRNLTIFGNFDFPLGTNAVSIDGMPIAPSTFLPGSNNLQLVIRIPTTLTVPQSGRRPVVVRIVNSRGSDQRSYVLLPEVIGGLTPDITEVRDTATNGSTLRSGEEARIVGIDFATPATDNQVVLVLNSGPGERRFELAAKAGSEVRPSPQSSTLLVDMPDLGDADGVPLGLTAPGVLSVDFPEAIAPASEGVSIQRIA